MGLTCGSDRDRQDSRLARALALAIVPASPRHSPAPSHIPHTRGSHMPVDILAFGPHPDDAEIGAGGVLRKLKDRGRTTGIVDMTSGDMGWGTPEQRAEEGRQAAKILKLDVRECLDLGDCRVEDTFENRVKTASMIRRHRPQIVL